MAMLFASRAGADGFRLSAFGGKADIRKSAARSANDPPADIDPVHCTGLGNPVGTSRLKLRIESELPADLTGIKCGAHGLAFICEAS
jgi:hypothetical protein